MRIRPEARAILERAVPDRLDSLWCEILASEYGAELLRAWDLTLDEVTASAPVMKCDSAHVLRFAKMLSHSNAPMVAAEWVAEDLLTSRQVWAGPSLSHFTAGDIEYHEVKIRDVYALAFEEGLEEAQECHYLRAASEAWPAMVRILEFCERPLDSFDRKYNCTPRDGPVDVAQLAQACLRELRFVAWMESLGIAAWRLRDNVLESGLRMCVSVEKLRWMKPACEEARLLGSPTVGTDHLLLALLGELHGVTIRVLREQGVDVRALRHRLEAGRAARVPVREMAFDPELLAVVQAACEADGKDPYSGVLLRCLLEHVEFPEIPKERILPALQRMLSGSLAEDLSMDGLRLGMGEGEVCAILGAPAFQKESCWMYPDTSVHWKEGRVHGVLGKQLQSGNHILEQGSPWIEAERLLGALRLWHGGPGPVWAMITRGNVQMLTLSLDEGHDPT